MFSYFLPLLFYWKNFFIIRLYSNYGFCPLQHPPGGSKVCEKYEIKKKYVKQTVINMPTSDWPCAKLRYFESMVENQ